MSLEITSGLSTPESLHALIKSRRYGTTNEAELCGEIEDLFRQNGIDHVREATLAAAYRPSGIVAHVSAVARRRAQLTRTERHGDRIDFLVGRIGIEVKTRHSRADVLRQLDRYAQSEMLDSLILVTTRAQHRDAPESIRGKPLALVYLCPL